MIQKFFEFTEIRTKITSVFPFFMSLAYVIFQGAHIRLLPSAVFFGSMFLFDLTTTAINNFVDTKTNGLTIPYSRKTGKLIIIGMLLSSIALGLFLVSLTDSIVLFAGMLCFGCGLLYTGSPVAISRLPLGELLSGIFYGFFIPFFVCYINLPAGSLFTATYSQGALTVVLQVLPLFKLFVFSAIPLCTTANIMLANNTCDIEKDLEQNRFTLPWFIGKKAALHLFAILYYSCFAAIILMLALRQLPYVCALSLLTIIPVNRNIQIFKKEQDKQKTFAVSISNFILLNGSLLLLLCTGIVIKKLI